MRRWGLLRDAACRLAAVGFAGRWDACLDAVLCAVAVPVRYTGCFVPSWRVSWSCGGPSVRHVIVSGGGLRRSPRHCFDCLDGRLAYVAGLAFGHGAGQVADEKAW